LVCIVFRFTRRCPDKPVIEDSHLLRNVLSISSINVFIQVFGVFSGILIARLFGPEGRGEYAAIILWPTIFTSIGLMGLDVKFAQLASKKAYTKSELYGLSVFFASTIGILLVLIGFFVFPQLLATSAQHLESAVRLYSLAIPFSLLVAYISAVELGSQDIRRYNYCRFFYSPLYLIFLIGLYFAEERRIEYAAYLVVLASAINSVFWASSAASFRNIFRIEKIRLLKDSVKLGISNLTLSVTGHLSSIILVSLASMQEVGFYMVAQTAASSLAPISHAIAKVLFSKALTKDKDDFVTRIPMIYRLLFVIYGSACAGLFIVSYALLPIIFGEDFSSARFMLGYLVPAAGLSALVAVLDEMLKGVNVTAPGIFARLIGTLFLLVLGSLVFIEFGIVGFMAMVMVRAVIEIVALSVKMVVDLNLDIRSLCTPRMEDFSYLIKALNGSKAR